MKRLRSCALLLFLVSSVPGQVAPRLVYRVEVKADEISAAPADSRRASSFHHALTIESPQTDEVRLSVAAWAPGSYRLMKVFQNIKDVTASDETGGARAVRKEGDLTWIVSAKGASRLDVAWRFEESKRALENRSYLNESGALLDGPRNYLYWRDRKELPAHVHFKLPEGWKVATGLTPTFDPMVFHAADTDWLLDCPVLMGRLETWTFVERGVPHRVALDNRGRAIDFDAAGFVDGIHRVVKTGIDLWGFVPYPHYTFLFSAGGGGGLEHLTSTTIGVNTRALGSNPNAHQGTIAHEFFHAWNVKRLRPKSLGPFDYDGPVRTKSLWISEGITNYYTNVILGRSGLVDEAGFLAAFERAISQFVTNPASLTISPEEASWTVWDSAYGGGAISYYTQGEVLGLLMDLLIRRETGNKKTLDDAMALLYRRYAGASGFEPDDVIATIRDATGVDLRAFFEKHVSKAGEIDWATPCRAMGCIAKISRRPRTAINFTVGQGGTDGVAVKVPADSALFRMGLRDDDVVTAVNGTEVKTARALLDALRRLDVGAPVALSVRRNENTVSLSGAIEALTDLAELPVRREPPVVNRVPDESGLALSGFRPGDVVKAIDGVPVTTRDEFRAAAGKVREGAVVRVTVERAGEQKVLEHRATPSVTTTFTLDPDPAATPLELEIRNTLIHGPGAAAAAESRPVRKAG